MRQRRSPICAPRGWWNRLRIAHRRPKQPGEAGFTLIELIITIAILPIVIGGISVALISVITEQNTASNKISDSGDTSILSAVYVKDVQSAQNVTTDASATSPWVPCQTSSAILSLEWPSTNPVVVSYAVKQQPGGHAYSLYRYYCQGLTQETKIVAYNVQAPTSAQPLTAVVSGKACNPFSCSDEPAAAQAGWASAAGAEGVQLKVEAPEKANGTTITYGYALTGVPRISNNASRGCTTDCGGHPPLLLLGSGSPGVTCVGNDTITVDGTAAINSTSNPAVQTNGNGGFTSTTLYTDGPTASGATSGNNITVTSGSVTPGVLSADPYKDSSGNSLLTPPITEPLPNSVGNSYQGFPVYNSGNYSGPGIYTNTLKITSSQVLASGVYIFQNGLSISGNGTVTTASGGVFFYVYGGSLSITGNGSVTIDPMASPPAPAPGLVIWQDASDSSPMTLGGNGGAVSIGGTIYAPQVSLGAGGNGTLKIGSLVTSSVTCNGGGNSGQILIGST